MLWACVIGAHLQSVNNHYAKFGKKEWNLLNYRLHTIKQYKHSHGGVDLMMSKYNNPKNIIKCAQNIG